MEGHIEDMAARAAKPGCQAAKLVMMLQEQDRVALLGQDIGRSQTSETGSDHDHIVAISHSLQPVFGHKALSLTPASPKCKYPAIDGMRRTLLSRRMKSTSIPGMADNLSPILILLQSGGLHLVVAVTTDRVPLLLHVGTTPWPGRIPLEHCLNRRLVEIHGENAAGVYQASIGCKRIHSLPGLDCRYCSHEVENAELGPLLRVHFAAPGLSGCWTAQLFRQAPVMRVQCSVTNTLDRRQRFTGIASLHYCGLGGSSPTPWYEGALLHECAMTWCGELQWRARRAREVGFWMPRSQSDTTFRHLVKNTGTWSTKEYLPMAVWERTQEKESLVWQIEHHGAWSWEIGDRCGDGYVYLSGPDEAESHWHRYLAPGETFTTIPVAFGAVPNGFETACQALTLYRRAMRRENADNRNLPVIFNDYMNCLSADPTTEKEVPLIEVAADVGCEVFCIDAGWYDDGAWWSKIGQWREASSRFQPEGLASLLDRIRRKGMVPGLWLELEAMGLQCPLVKEWPPECFYRRHGEPVVARGRLLLDFRHPLVRHHADEVIDRLVQQWGVGYIKMDFNNELGLGTEVAADSWGDGMLQAQRAYLGWLDAVFTRFPDLVIENCASGGMRMDYAMLQRHSVQSISDEEDYRRMAVIAANGATAVAPEQQAVWSYPLRTGDLEETRMNMVNTLLLRIQQSGHLANLSPERLDAVREGIAVYKQIRHHIARGLPLWPLGTARFGCPHAVSCLVDGATLLAACWRFDDPSDTLTIPFPQWAGQPFEAVCLYPKDGAECHWESATGTLRIRLDHPNTARLIKLALPANGA